MNTEKVFWAMVAIVVSSLFLFLAFGGLVGPVSATQPKSLPDSYAAAPTDIEELREVKNGVQEVTLTVRGASYYPNPIRVKKGVPVRITADLSSVRGCASGIVIPDFDVRKTFRQGDNSVEFTPDKSGTFEFGCSMWMYKGKIVVEEADGSVAAFTGSAPKVAAGSCGGAGGGCGCGGGAI